MANPACPRRRCLYGSGSAALPGSRPFGVDEAWTMATTGTVSAMAANAPGLVGEPAGVAG